MHRQLVLAVFTAAFACATAEAARAPVSTTGPANLDLSYPAQPVSALSHGADPAALGRRQLLQQARLPRGGHASEFDSHLAQPSFVWAPADLTASAPMALDRAALLEAAGRDALSKQAFVLGLKSADISDARLTQLHDIGRGALIASYQQQFDGYEIFGRRLAVAMNSDLRVVATSGYFLPLDDAARSQASALGFDQSPQQAAVKAFADLGGTAATSELAESHTDGAYTYYTPATTTADYHLIGQVRSKRVRFPADGDLLPAYYLEIEAATVDGHRDDVYAYVVSAIDNRVLFRRDMKQYESFSYRVMADAANLNQPYDHPLGNGYLPVPSLDPNATYTRVPATPNLVTLQSSPMISTGDPWLTASATTTVGNNADAYLDLSAPDGYQPALGDIHAALTSTRTFDYPVAVDTDPTTANAQNAAIVNLFYLNNWLHDFWYDHGFNEAAGNAQNLNYGRGGIGADPILAQGQDYSGTNNANMSTPADGASPRMQMYLFDGIFDGALTILTPDLGDLSAAPATFGPKTFDLSNEIVAYVDGSAPTSDACTAATNAAALAGKIALIDRGNCDFTDKVANAQTAGAIGAIIVDNVPGEAPFSFGAAAPKVTIPSLMTGFEDGQSVRSALADGAVTARLLRNASIPLDGTIDNGVISHEFFHYVSNRLVADGSGLTNTQGGGMGEGWSDFDALLVAAREEDRAVVGNDRYQAPYSMGYYVLNDEYFGIRRAPYATNFAVNPLTFKYIENGVPLPTTAPLAFGADGASNAEVHNAGEVWAVTLWEAYVALLNDPRYSFSQARSRMQDYIVAGLKLTPTSPTFTEARDGILAAAMATDDADFDLINAAFARRGLGLYAVSAPRNTSTNEGVIESFVSQAAPLQTAEAHFDMSVQDASGSYCDTDSVLDGGETGLLSVRQPIGNVGALVDGTVATVSELSTHYLSLVDGDQLTMLPTGDGYLQGSLRVKLASGSAAPYSFKLQVALPEIGPTAIAQFVSSSASGNTLVPYYVADVNYDLLALNRATDNVEQAGASAHDWAVSQTGTTPAWRIADFDASFGTGNLWWGPSSDLASESMLTSPPISVLTLGGFTLAFDHYFAFSDSSGTVVLTSPDGGVIEVSIDGGAWQDVSTVASFTSGAYNGVVNTGSGNRAGYVATNGAISHVTLDFGSKVAGSSIRLRFHQYSNAGVGNIGWLIDNVAVNSNAVTPFSSVANENGVCVNRPPYVNAGPDVSKPSFAADGTTATVVTLQGSASDLDGANTLSYSWTQVSGTPVVTLSGANTLTPSFTAPVVTTSRSLVFQLTASDSITQSSDQVTVTITPANQAPVANAGADASATTGTAVTLNGSASSDADGSIASYSWAQTSGPATTLTNATTAHPKFTPTVAGSYLFTLTVTDDAGLSSTDSVTITVRSTPVANAGADVSVQAGTLVHLDGSASSDADGSIASYLWTQTAGPSVTLTGGTTAKPTFTPTSTGTYVFTLKVTDNDNLTSTDSVTVKVYAAPVANAGADQSVRAPITVTLDGSGSSDADGSISTYAWLQASGPTATLSNPAAVKPTFSATVGGTYVFTLTVTDNDGHTASDSVTITVAAAAVAPTANAGADATVLTGTKVTLDGSTSSDADGSIAGYAWTQTSGTSVTLTGATTAKPSFTPTLGGSYVFKLVVTDNEGLTASDSVTITVQAKPVADAGADATVTTGTAVLLNGGGSSDPDGSIASYAWAQTSGPAATLGNATTAHPSFTPATAGSYVFKLTVTDNSGLTATDSVTITAHTAPVANAGADFGVKVGTAAQLNGSASSDADGTISSYLWTQTAGASVTLTGGTTAKPTFTPTAIGTYSFTLKVTDNDNLTSTDSVTVSAYAAPVANAGADQSVTTPATVTLDGSGSTDADGTISSFAWVQTSGPSVSLSNPSVAKPSFSATVSGTYVFTLTVTDNDGHTSASDSVTITARTAPVANAGADAKAFTGAVVTLDGSASTDADGSISSYAWTKTSGPSVTLTGASSAKASFTPTTAGSYVFTLTVTDNSGLTASDSVTITVQAKPIANAGADATATTGTAVALNGSASSDPDGSIASYAWAQTSGPATTLSNATTARPSFTPTVAGSYVFALTVTDNSGLTATDSVTITARSAPVANAGADAKAFTGAVATLDGSASTDADGTISSYAWTQTSGKSVTLTGASSAKASFTPTAADSYVFTLTVTDNDGLKGSDSVTITVQAKPIANAGTDAEALTGTTVTLDGSASSDADGTISSYAWTKTGGPSVTLTGASSAKAGFTPAVAGSYVFTLKVTDNDGNTASDSVTITVHSAPIADAGADFSVKPGVTAQLNGSASKDSDGSISSYLWTQTSGPAVTLVGPTTSKPTFTSSNPALYTFVLKVTDNDGETSSDSVSVRVYALPVANAGADQSVRAPATVTLNGGASSDADGSITGYAWTQTSGANVSLSSATAASPSFSVAAAGSFAFTLKVTDNDGNTASDSVTVTVAAPAIPPTADAGADAAVAVGSAATLNGGGSNDADGDITGYHWVEESGPAVALSGGDTKAPSFTPATPGSYVFKLTVTDNDGLTASDSVTITVQGPPVADAGDPLTVVAGTAVALDGSGSSSGGSITSYLWKQTAGTAVTLTTPNAVSAHFTPGAAGSYVFDLTVIDNTGQTSSASVTVTATAASTDDGGSGGGGGGGAIGGGTLLALLAALGLRGITRRRRGSPVAG
jgi:hypothetical protein